MPRERDRKSDAMRIEDKNKSTDARMREASVKRVYMLYTDQEKVRFFNLLFEKCLCASAAAKQLGIHARTLLTYIVLSVLCVLVVLIVLIARLLLLAQTVPLIRSTKLTGPAQHKKRKLGTTRAASYGVQPGI